MDDKTIEGAENVFTAIGYQVSANTMIVGEDAIRVVFAGDNDRRHELWAVDPDSGRVCG